MALSAGDAIGNGRFVVEASLGSGATGTAYRARDCEHGIAVALKTVHRVATADVSTLKREFRRLAGISHLHLVRLYELFASDDECFFTMELVEGGDLVTGLRGALEPGQALGPAADAATRAAFVQLARGLRALHELGHAHGDLKPSNVLLSSSGRVVLLDFSLSAPLRGRAPRAARGAFDGSLGYSAPELSSGSGASEAADWYALGALLHEALTGVAAFRGTFASVMDAKQSGVIPRPSTILPAVDPALDDLVRRLLAHDPATRPGFAAIVERLGSAAGAAPSPAPPPKLRGPFVGRGRELATLARWLAEASDGVPVVGHVRGPSGVGKTELVRRFLDALPLDRALVLRGCCHPQESVPHKALDPLVDELVLVLADGAVPVPRTDAAGAAALARLFPALSGVPELRCVPSDASREPFVIRREAVHALRALLAGLSATVPLVLWVDDAQWGDADSAALLRELLRPPGAPRVLLLVAHRESDGERGVFLEELTREEQGGASVRRELVVPPLASDESEQLAELLLEHVPGAARALVKKRISGDAAGSPFLLGELARFLGVSDADAPDTSVSDVALVTRARVARLSPAALDLLELAAVARGPVETAVVLDAAGIGRAGWPLLLDLCAQCLLREGDARGARPETVETYHDRTRECVLTDLARSPERQRRRHRQLADALAARPDADPQVLLEHLVGAGDEARAAEHALRAAGQASAALAFARAAELYATAIRLRGERAEDWPLRVERARLLGAAGRNADAGALLEQAAREAARSSRDPEAAAELLARAAEHDFYAGLLAPGTRLLREAMHHLGLSVPATPRAAMRTSIALRLQFLLRGSGLARVDPARLEARQLLRLDALYGAARGTVMLDHRLADALAMHHLLGALRLGEPSRALRALCMEAASEANVGGRWLRARSTALLEQADALAGRTGVPYDRAVVLVHRGAVALFSARFSDAVAACEQAAAIFRTRCTGAAWEETVCQSFLVAALAQQGDLRELRRRTSALLDDARERGDRYAGAFFRSNDCVLEALGRDDPDAALAGAESALDGVPEGHFTSMHFGHLVAAVRVHLYRGHGARAWRTIDDAWPRLRASGFLALEGLGLVLHYLRGCAALAALESASTSGSRTAPRDAGAPRLRRAVVRSSRRLRRVSLPTGAPLAHALDAGLYALDGAHQRRAPVLEAAIAGFDAVKMSLHRESARLIRGLAIGDDHEVRRARGWMAEQEVRDPVALARATVPGPFVPPSVSPRAT